MNDLDKLAEEILSYDPSLVMTVHTGKGLYTAYAMEGLQAIIKDWQYEKASWGYLVADDDDIVLMDDDDDTN